MSSESFCYWLRGYFEIAGETPLTREQVEIISKHLSLVFTDQAKDTPPVSKKESVPAVPEPDASKDSNADAFTVKDLERWMREMRLAAGMTGGRDKYCTTVSC